MARILIVDDSPFLVKQIRSFLEESGHEVVAEGGDGFEGVALYLEHRPDLMLVDITMPNKDGKQCLEEIFAADQDACALVVSAVKDRKLLMSCLDLGAKGFVEKPLKLKDETFRNEFRAAIAEAIEK